MFVLFLVIFLLLITISLIIKNEYYGGLYSMKSRRTYRGGNRLFDLSKEIEYPYINLFWTEDELLNLFDEFKNDNSGFEHVETSNFGLLEINEPRGSADKVILAGDKYEPLVDYFQEEVRIQCKRSGKLSPLEVFKTPAIIKRWSQKYKGKSLGEKELREMSQHMKQYKNCDLMSAYVVKALIDEYKAKKILMPTGGWGDAIVASMASGVDYLVAVDPNESAVSNWHKMLDMYIQNGKDYNFIVSPFEEVEEKDLIEGDLFDMIYSSPPYFASEEYSKDEGQSYLKHKGIDNWLDNFIKPSFSKAWNLLKDNGYLVIIINDIIYNGEEIHFVQLMHDFIDSLEGATYVETRGFKKFDWQRNYQPIFIWQKKV